MSFSNVKSCEECGNPMTLLLNSYVCDWCDGLVADEWDNQEDTKPLFSHELVWTGMNPFDNDEED